jgi:hypothetical protein
MAAVGIIIVGRGVWEEYTKPCINSILTVEPEAEILVVDVLGDYPEGSGYSLVKAIGSKSYAEGINVGLREAQKNEYTWYLVTNNDTLYEKPFIKRIEKRKTECLIRLPYIFRAGETLYL